MALKHVEGKHEDSSDLFFWDDVLKDEGPESIFDFPSEIKEEARHARDRFEIAKITAVSVEKESDAVLTNFIAHLHGLWSKHFNNTDRESVDDLKRARVIKAFTVVYDEMKRRGMKVDADRPLARVAGVRQPSFEEEEELEEEARHVRDKCMSCDKPPTIDVLWAEGIGHAWFCDKCFTAWEKEHPGDVNNTKKLEHGIARMKFSDRNSPESLREQCAVKDIPLKGADLFDEEILVLNQRLQQLWKLHFEGNDAKVVKGKGDLTRVQVEAGLKTLRAEMKKRNLEEAGRRVQAKRVKQVKDIIQAWQKLRTELEDWLKWAEYMDGDWVEAPNIHGEPVKGEIMQELLGHYVTISGTRVFIQEKAAVSFAPRDREWDATAAEKRVRAWADAEDGPNAKYAQAFFYKDPDRADDFGGYKLLYKDIVGGELKVVPRAIFAVFGVLQGARGGVKIPEKDKQAIRRRVEGFYAKMRKEFDDESLGKE